MFEIAPFVVGVSGKVCRKCGEWKPLDKYWREKASRDGVAATCASCKSVASKARYAADPSKSSVRSKHYREANRERVADYQREWVAEHKEHVQEYQRQYREAHAEKRREYAREYRTDYIQTERGKAVLKAKDHRRRARKTAAGSYSAEDLAAIRAAQTDKKGWLICWRCHKPIKGTPELDHFIPLDKGGANTAGNLHFMHAHCNRTKHAKHPHDLGMLI